MAGNDSTGWMPAAGGILNIISGVFGILGSFVFIFISTFMNSFDNFYTDPGIVDFPMALWWFAAAYLIITSIVALVGGIFAVQKKLWGLSLAGSIAAILQGGNILGIISTAFIALSKKEFKS
jgi:hypothetical protein